MHTSLFNRALWERRSARSEDGFTLVELLVVILVIGILTAIAVPVFLNQRNKAAEASLKSDLKSLGIEMETEMTSTGKYPDAIPDTFRASEGNSFKIGVEAGSTNISAGSQANSTTVQPGRVAYHIGAASPGAVSIKRNNTEGTATYTGTSMGGPYWDYDPAEPIPANTTLTGSLEVKSNKDVCTPPRFEVYLVSGTRVSDYMGADKGCLVAGEWKEISVTYTTTTDLDRVTLTAYTTHEAGEVFEFRKPVIVFGSAVNKGNVDVAFDQKFCVEGSHVNTKDNVWHYSALDGGVKEGRCS